MGGDELTKELFFGHISHSSGIMIVVVVVVIYYYRVEFISTAFSGVDHSFINNWSGPVMSAISTHVSKLERNSLIICPTSSVQGSRCLPAWCVVYCIWLRNWAANLGWCSGSSKA